MNDNKLTRDSILALDGAGLDKAVAEATGIEIRTGGGQLWRRGNRWSPSQDRNQLAEAEAALDEAQRERYGNELAEALHATGRLKQPHFTYSDYAVQARLLNPSDCCRALLLAVMEADL